MPKGLHAFDTDTPVLIFGGPLSNLQALRALRQEAERRNIPPENIICTGDTVAYCANPSETVAELRAWGCCVLAGNCERQLAAGADTCGCGFEDGSLCDLFSGPWFRHAAQALTDETRDWMAGLPDLITFSHQGKQAAALHGGLTDISRFLWPVTPQSAFEEELDMLAQAMPSGTAPDLVFAGHCGLPFTRRIGSHLWVNAGTIGMPANDGRPETRFAVLQNGEVALHNLTYDHKSARAAMISAGLTQGYHNSLTTGLWPSQDILPAELRQS